MKKKLTQNMKISSLPQRHGGTSLFRCPVERPRMWRPMVRRNRSRPQLECSRKCLEPTRERTERAERKEMRISEPN